MSSGKSSSWYHSPASLLAFIIFSALSGLLGYLSFNWWPWIACHPFSASFFWFIFRSKVIAHLDQSFPLSNHIENKSFFEAADWAYSLNWQGTFPLLDFNCRTKESHSRLCVDEFLSSLKGTKARDSVSGFGFLFLIFTLLLIGGIFLITLVITHLLLFLLLLSFFIFFIIFHSRHPPPVFRPSSLRPHHALRRSPLPLLLPQIRFHHLQNSHLFSFRRCHPRSFLGL